MTVKGILKNPSPTHSLWTSGWFEFSPEERIYRKIHFNPEDQVVEIPMRERVTTFRLKHVPMVEDSDSE